MIRLAAALALIAAPQSAMAETKAYGPFRFDTDYPQAAVLAGEIDHHSAFDFRKMVDQNPEIQFLGLDSPGGDVTAGLLVAMDVFDRGISTQIPTGRGCYSACAYIFLAGKSRQVDGEIGVHMPRPLVEIDGARVLVENDIRYALAKFDVPIWIYDGILNTPSDDIRIFSAAEAVEIGLNR